MQKRLYLESCKSLPSIINDSVIMCDDIIEETKTVSRNFNEKMQPLKQSFYILLAFILIVIRLLIAVRIYCYLIKYKAKLKHTFPYYITN